LSLLASASADHKKEAARTKLNEAKKKGELSAEMKEEFQHVCFFLFFFSVK